jgi:hypothetical protein
MQAVREDEGQDVVLFVLSIRGISFSKLTVPLCNLVKKKTMIVIVGNY